MSSAASAIDYIYKWERQGIGAQWKNFFDDPDYEKIFGIGWSVIMMLINTLLHLILLWYFEKVVPGKSLQIKIGNY